jgi:hypothetical protein
VLAPLLQLERDVADSVSVHEVVEAFDVVVGVDVVVGGGAKDGSDGGGTGEPDVTVDEGEVDVELRLGLGRRGLCIELVVDLRHEFDGVGGGGGGLDVEVVEEGIVCTPNRCASGRIRMGSIGGHVHSRLHTSTEIQRRWVDQRGLRRLLHCLLLLRHGLEHGVHHPR